MNISVITHIAAELRVFIAPLLSGNTKKRHIEQISFAGIYTGYLLATERFRNEVFFYRIGMDQVIDFGQVAANIPA